MVVYPTFPVVGEGDHVPVKVLFCCWVQDRQEVPNLLDQFPEGQVRGCCMFSNVCGVLRLWGGRKERGWSITTHIPLVPKLEEVMRALEQRETAVGWGVGYVVGVEIGIFTRDTTAWIDCFAIAEEPLTLERPLFTSEGAGCDGAKSIGSSDLAGGKADTGVIDTMWGGGAIDVDSQSWGAGVCAGAKQLNICSMHGLLKESLQSSL